MLNKNKIERKKFFKTIGLSALGVGLFSLLPFRTKSKANSNSRKVTVKIHPSAVKRNS